MIDISTDFGRAVYLSNVALNEGNAVALLDSIIQEMSGDEQLSKAAIKHRADEIRHEVIVRKRLAELGLMPADVTPLKNAADRLYTKLGPRTVAEKYGVLQVLEEYAVDHYTEIANAFRPDDLETAEMFDGIVRDEASHLRYCAAVGAKLGGKEHIQTMDRYRRTYLESINDPLFPDPAVEVFDKAKHFAMWESWGEKADPSACGAGLIIPGFCGGFIDQIGTTSNVYLHGLRTNPAKPLSDKIRTMVTMREAMIAAVKGAGFTRGFMTTNNMVIERGFSERLGWTRNGEYIIAGVF